MLREEFQAHPSMQHFRLDGLLNMCLSDFLELLMSFFLLNRKTRDLTYCFAFYIRSKAVEILY